MEAKVKICFCEQFNAQWNDQFSAL